MRAVAVRLRRHWIPALVFAALLALSWYPFHLDAAPLRRNHVETIDGRTLRFREVSFAWTSTPPSWLASAIDDAAFTIALDVQPSIDQRSPATIFTVSLDIWRSDITVEQERTALVVRMRRPGANSGGWPVLVIPSVFTDGGRRAIALEVAGGQLRITVDHVRRLTVSVGDHALDTWDPGYRLALGSELTVEQTWAGEIYEATVTTRGQTVDYLEPGRLQLPAHYWRTAWLGDPETYKGNGGLLSVVFHAAAYASLGAAFSLTAYGRPSRRSILWLAVVAATVTEFGQTGLVDRHFAFADMAVNLAAVVAGGLIVRMLRLPAPWTGDPVRGDTPPW